MHAISVLKYLLAFGGLPFFWWLARRSLPAAAVVQYIAYEEWGRTAFLPGHNTITMGCVSGLILLIEAVRQGVFGRLGRRNDGAAVARLVLLFWGLRTASYLVFGAETAAQPLAALAFFSFRATIPAVIIALIPRREGLVQAWRALYWASALLCLAYCLQGVVVLARGVSPEESRTLGLLGWNVAAGGWVGAFLVGTSFYPWPMADRIEEHPPVWRPLLGLAAAIMLVLLSGTRNFLINLVLVVGLCSLLAGPRPTRRAATWVLAAIGAVLLIAPTLNLASRLPQPIARPYAFLTERFRAKYGTTEWLSGRYELAQYAWQRFQGSPFVGVGESNGGMLIPSVYDPHRQVTLPEHRRPPHDAYLRALSEQGLAGGALLMAMVLKLLALGYRSRRFARDQIPEATVRNSALVLGLVGLVEAGVGAGLWLYPSLALLAAAHDSYRRVRHAEQTSDNAWAPPTLPVERDPDVVPIERS